MSNSVSVLKSECISNKTYLDHQIKNMCKTPYTRLAAEESGQIDILDHGVVIAGIVASDTADLSFKKKSESANEYEKVHTLPCLVFRN